MNDALTSLLREVKDALYVDQPYLEVSIQGDMVVVEGTYLLLAGLPEYRDRGPLAQHKLRVETRADYPAKEPKVTMLDGSVPRNDSHHCARDGVCCITVFETWAATRRDTSIGAYFEGPFRNYFLGQLLKREGKNWPFDEWDHGVDGWIDAMAEFIGCRPGIPTVANVLKWWMTGDSVNAAGPCPCGSGRANEVCCGASLQRFAEEVSPETARAWRERLNNLIKKRDPNEILRKIHKNRPFNKVQSAVRRPRKKKV